MRALLAAALVAALAAASLAESPSPALEEAGATLRAGDTEKALALLDAARKTETSPDQRTFLALLYAELKRYDVAESLMKRLIRESPKDARLRLHLATILARAGDRGATLEALAQARARGPNAEDRQRMAFLYQDFKDNAAARELLDELIAASPGDVALRLDRASLAAQTGDAAEGRKQLDAAKELAPSPSAEDRRRMEALERALSAGRPEERAAYPAESLHARLDLAIAAARKGDPAAALKILEAARGEKPDLQERQKMAVAYQEAHEFKTARSLIDALIQEQPRDPQLRLDRAFFAAESGDASAALDFLAETMASAPDPDDSERAATLYDRLGKPEKARAVREGPGKKSR